jgi:hypothetical protein
LIDNFCGKVIENIETLTLNDKQTDLTTLIYLTGNVQKNLNVINQNEIKYKKIRIINDFSYNTNIFDNNLNNNSNTNLEFIDMAEVPINIHNCGVFFHNMFDSSKDYFDLLTKEHQFQDLTESNKPSNAFRKGIYLCNVKQDKVNTTENTGTEEEQKDEEKEGDIHFNLLRCSSNLGGATDNYRDTDLEIVNKVNMVANDFFKEKVKLNHTLAQIYENHIVDNQEKKAKIKAHSDKTKDMPRNALMAFCTFYKSYYNGKFNEEHLKNITLTPEHFTRLVFKLKNPEVNRKLGYVDSFSIVLYPNSVFLMSLATNRLYTHEIKPSYHSIKNIPTRLGYVVRCSNTEAVYRNGQTYIKEGDKLIKLEKIDITNENEQVQELRKLYYQENLTTDLVEYNDLYFSMNNGDYMKPIL